MKDYMISINQLAEFPVSTPNGKKRIVSQQLNPNKLKIGHYQMTKARVRKSIERKGDLEPVYDGISILMNRKTNNKRQENVRVVSIQGLERFLQMKLPNLFSELDYKTIKPKVKSFLISDVKVIVAPEVIIQGEYRGKTVLGGVKIHIAKGKPFNLKQSRIVATMVHEYLQSELAKEDVVVMPELCLCIDIFGERIISAEPQNKNLLKEINDICLEIRQIYDSE